MRTALFILFAVFTVACGGPAADSPETAPAAVEAAAAKAADAATEAAEAATAAAGDAAEAAGDAAEEAGDAAEEAGDAAHEAHAAIEGAHAHADGTACTCAEGKAGGTLWCDACDAGYIAGEKTTDKAAVDAALAQAD